MDKGTLPGRDKHKGNRREWTQIHNHRGSQRHWENHQNHQEHSQWNWSLWQRTRKQVPIHECTQPPYNSKEDTSALQILCKRKMQPWEHMHIWTYPWPIWRSWKLRIHNDMQSLKSIKKHHRKPEIERMTTRVNSTAAGPRINDTLRPQTKTNRIHRKNTAPTDHHAPGGDLDTKPARQAPKAYAKPKAGKHARPDENPKDHPPGEEPGSTPEPPAPRTKENTIAKKTQKTVINPSDGNQGKLAPRVAAKIPSDQDKTGQHHNQGIETATAIGHQAPLDHIGITPAGERHHPDGDTSSKTRSINDTTDKTTGAP